MHTQLLGFVVAALTATMASGQPSAQNAIIRIANSDRPEDLQQIAIAVRVMTGITQMSVDTGKSAMTVTGLSDQIALAQWLAGELDQPTGGSANASEKHEYRIPGDSDELVRVFPISHSETPRSLQEMATLIRVIADIPRVVVYNSRPAITARGTAAQIAVSAWLVNELDKPAEAQAPAPAEAHEYRIPGDSDQLVRVFSISSSATPQSLQEIAIAVRTVADIPRVVVYNSRPAITARGTAAQIALSAWLVDELDQPAEAQTSASAGPHEYRMPGSDVIRVFRLAHSEMPENLQKVAVAVRSATNARRLFTNTDQKAIVMRGTPDQIATAERVIGDIG